MPVFQDERVLDSFKIVGSGMKKKLNKNINI